MSWESRLSWRACPRALRNSRRAFLRGSPLRPVGLCARAEHRGLDAGHHQAADQRPGDVVLLDLQPRLAGDPLEVLAQLLVGLLAGAERVEVEVVHGHAPLEQQGEQHVVDRLEQIDRVPLLVGVDPHDLVAEILVLAPDVRVGVVDVVVGVAPGLRRRGGVPVPRPRVDDRVVHPVPLAVQDVMADLHVLEDLGHAQGGRAEDPGSAPARGDELQAADQGQAPLHGDDRADVARVAIAEIVLDGLVQRLELASDLLDLLRR